MIKINIGFCDPKKKRKIISTRTQSTLVDDQQIIEVSPPHCAGTKQLREKNLNVPDKIDKSSDCGFQAAVFWRLYKDAASLTTSSHIECGPKLLHIRRATIRSLYRPICS